MVEGAGVETGQLGGATGSGTIGGLEALTGDDGTVSVCTRWNNRSARSVFDVVGKSPESLGSEASPVVVEVMSGSGETMSISDSVGTGEDTTESEFDRIGRRGGRCNCR